MRRHCCAAVGKKRQDFLLLALLVSPFTDSTSRRFDDEDTQQCGYCFLAGEHWDFQSEIQVTNQDTLSMSG